MLILLPEKINKLVISWKDPCKVVSAVTNVDCIVDFNNRKTIFHINMLRKYLERPEFLKKLLNDDTSEDPQQANSVFVLPDEDCPDVDILNCIEFVKTR